MHVFGVDIGGTTVKIGRFTEDGNIKNKWEIPTRKENDGELILQDIADSIHREMGINDIGASEVIGIGIGVPGPVLENGVVNGCVNLGWKQKDVTTEMQELMHGIPAHVGNDANVAALGEYWKGGGKGFNNVIMVTLGTGVGAGIILQGKILAGTNGAGGEIGHFHVNDEETELCGCGKAGCLEQYASATGVVRMANKVLNTTDKSVLKDLSNLSCKDVFDAAKEGDPAAASVVEQLGKTLGTALAHVSATVDPEVFVIGGGVSKAGQIVIDVVQKYYKKYAFHATENAEFKLAVLSNDAGMYGAVKMAIDGNAK